MHIKNKLAFSKQWNYIPILCYYKFFPSFYSAELDYLCLIVYKSYITTFFFKFSSQKGCLQMTRYVLLFSFPVIAIILILWPKINQIHRFILILLLICFFLFLSPENTAVKSLFIYIWIQITSNIPRKYFCNQLFYCTICSKFYSWVKNYQCLFLLAWDY